MNSNCLYIEIGPSALKLLNETERFECPLDRLPNGRLTDTCKQKLTTSLQDFLKRKSWKPRSRAWCAINARGVSLRRLKLPASSKEELQRLLRLQIESEFPLPPDQLAWGWQQLPQAGTGQQEVVVVAVKKEVVKDYAEVLSACGVNPIFTVAALARNAICSPAPKSYAVLDLGNGHAELISFEQGAASSIRVLPLGDGNGAGQDSAIESLTACISSQSIGQKLFLTGSDGRQQEIASRLGKQLGGGVEVQAIPIPEENVSAAILGLKRSNESGHLPVSLQFDEAVQRENVRDSAPWKWVAFAAVLGLVLLFRPYAEALVLEKRLVKKLAAIKADSARLGIIDREFNFLQNLKKSQSPYLDALYLFANSATNEMRFDSISMNRRGEISLKGNIKSGQHVTDFRSRLIASGFFSTVVVDEQTPTPDRQKVAVRITAQWKPANVRKPVIDPTPTNAVPATVTNAVPTNAPTMAKKAKE